MLMLVECQICLSQNFKIDSLKSLLDEKSGVDYSDVLYQLAYEFVETDYQLGLYYAKKAFAKAQQSNDSFRIVRAGRINSLVFRKLDEIDSGLIISLKIIPIARRNNYTGELKSILLGLGLTYTYKASYDKALTYFFEALDLQKKDNDKFGISVVLQNIGLVYYKLKDYDIALDYFKRSLELKNSISNKSFLEILLVNISLCYSYKSNFAEAQKFINKAFSVCDRNCSETFLVHAHFGLGVISFRKQKFSDAETQFLKSYMFATKSGNERFQLDNINHLLQIYLLKNQISQAENYLKKAEDLIALGISYNLELIKVYSQLSNVFLNAKDFEKVAIYQNKYIELKDSIYNEALTTNLMKVEADHLEKENKSKIEFQNKILLLNQEVITRQKFLNIFTGIIAMLLVVLAIVLIKSNRQKRKIHYLLDEKVKERTHDLELNRDALQRACEARDALLHKTSSDINHSLATVKGLCLLGLKDIEDPHARQYLEKMNTASDNFSVILRNLHLTRLEL
jgi:tetratricopeptide (TPR) repeat protein